MGPTSGSEKSAASARRGPYHLIDHPGRVAQLKAKPGLTTVNWWPGASRTRRRQALTGSKAVADRAPTRGAQR